LIEISFLILFIPRKLFTGYTVCASIILICCPWVITKEITKAISTGEPTSKHLQLNNRFMIRNNLTLVPDISFLLPIFLKPFVFSACVLKYIQDLVLTQDGPCRVPSGCRGPEPMGSTKIKTET
jgi:hypothetical protein